MVCLHIDVPPSTLRDVGRDKTDGAVGQVPERHVLLGLRCAVISLAWPRP